MEENKESRFILTIVILGDLVVINALFCILAIFGNNALFTDSNILRECVIASLCYLSAISFFGDLRLYRRRVRPDQIVTGVIGTTSGFFIIWLAALAISDQELDLSLSIFAYFFASLFLISCHRLSCKSIIKRWRKTGRNLCNVIFVGSTQNMIELYEEMALDNSTGYNIYGYFDTQPNPKFNAKYLGECDKIDLFIADNSVQRLYCSLPSAMKDTILNIIASCDKRIVRFYSVPNLRNYLSRRVNLELFSNTPVLSIRTEPLDKIDNRVIKRTFDIIFSLLFLVTLFPIIFIIFGTLIKISSKGPIIFKQRRNGVNGKVFWCLKFRSMRINDEADTLQATNDDPRKTKIGDFMRRTNIDELPQFINVLFGQMSVVGPRPHMLQHTKDYSDLIETYMVRHLVKPGVTGWAQVNGYRGETKNLDEMSDRVKADIWYMEHWTFILDIYIIYKTVANILYRKDKRAY